MTPGSHRIGWKDHPRGCGEHDMSRQKEKGTKGSSPRMRGALLGDQSGVVGLRIIPADAGSTMIMTENARRFGDHPRGCGELSPPGNLR